MASIGLHATKKANLDLLKKASHKNPMLLREGALDKLPEVSLRYECQKVLQGYENRVNERVYDIISREPVVMSPQRAEDHVNRIIGDIMREHESALSAFKKIHSERAFLDGKFLDSDELKTAGHSFDLKHVFIVVNGKITPLVEFSEK